MARRARRYVRPLGQGFGTVELGQERFKREIVLDWDDVRETFLSIAGGKRHPQDAINRTVADARNDPGFYGNTVDEMVGYLKNGFDAGMLGIADDLVKPIETPEIIWDEEGENIDVCAALAGDDEPFFQYDDVPNKPGVRIVAELAFLGGTRASVLAEYGAWLAAMIADLEGDGVDVELDIALPSGSNLVKGDHNSQNQMIIRVKRAGEIRDFADYSALFAPGGFRLLGFTARAMACQAWGVVCEHGYGRSLPRKWGVEWDATERVLTTTRPAMPDGFPRDAMTAELQSVLG